MKKLPLFFTATVLVALLQNTQAQNLLWAKQLGGTGADGGSSIAIDAAGNVYTLGYFNGTADIDPGPATLNFTSAGSSDIFITKLGASGNLVWAKQFGGTASDEGNSIAIDAAGNVYTTGRFNGTADFDPGPATFNLTSAGNNDIFITKLDASGNLLWAKRLGGAGGDYGEASAIDAAGNVYVTGYFINTVDFDPGPATSNLTSAGGEDIFITKLDASGNLVWAKRLGGTGSSEYGKAIAVDTAGNIYTTGNFTGTADFDPGPATFNLTAAGNNDIFISKLDSSGNLVWAKQFGGVSYDYGRSIAVDASGSVYATGYFHVTADFDPGAAIFNLTAAGQSDIFIIKLNTSGNFVWAKQLGGTSFDDSNSIAVDAAGNVFTIGIFTETADFDPGAATFNLTAAGGSSSDIFITKLDASGNFVWAKQFGATSPDVGQSIATDATGNVYTTGYFNLTVDFDPGPATSSLTALAGTDAFILKLTPLSPFVIKGNIYRDDNGNCSKDSSDRSLYYFFVKAEPGPFYGVSNSDGDYFINLLDTGSYTISAATHDILWQQNCTTSYTVQLAGTPGITSGINFSMQAAFPCTRLSVDIGAPELTRCFGTHYFILYGNTGSLLAPNAYVEIDFGSSLIYPIGGTIPWSSVGGNVYTFPLGNLDINHYGRFSVNVHADCALPFGSTKCVTARIYPDSLCIPPPAGWDKSETAVSSTCVNDSLVVFTIKNRSAAGLGDMNGPAQWRLYVNDTLVAQSTYQLAGGDTMVKYFPANGKTYRLEAEQHPQHPRRTMSKVIVEACGSPATFGYVNTVTQDDDELSVATFCTTVTGSYDPNDKQVSPIGITSNNYITAQDELEYMIRFQNTGTDTALTVVIRDTIATGVLNIVTLVSGVSSHDYIFNIYGHGIAEWTFDNILLPDSNVNEPASHGFVKFKIKQLPNNPDGTVIENRAAIYFDFNEPVITNTTRNEVNEAGMPVSFLSASIDSTTDIAACHGDSSGAASVTASGGLSPYQFTWSNGATAATVTNLIAGNYSITITDAAENTWIDSVNIAEPALLEAAITSKTDLLCFGDGTGTATAASTGGTPPYSYEWSHQGSASATATSLNAGVYSVTVWDAHLCTAATSSITITEPAQLTAFISTQSGVKCFGGNDAAAKTSPAGGVAPYTVQWSDGQTGSTATDLSAGNYQITVADSNGCEIITSITIQDGYQINTGAIAGADSANINQTATYSVNAGFAYTWSVTNGTIISGQGTNTVEVDWNTIGQGTLQAAITDSGCTQTVSKAVALVDPTGIENNVLRHVQLFPNPTKGTVTLRMSVTSPVAIKLYDTVGKMLIQRTIDGNKLHADTELDLFAFNEGIFFLQIQSGNDLKVMKVVKY